MKARQSYDVLLKCVLIGDSKTGKTALCKRFDNGKFDENSYEQSFGVEFYSKILNKNGERIKLQLWDTPPEAYLTSSLLRNANILFVLFDVTNPNSFKKIDDWLMLAKYIEANADSLSPAIILVGTKIDAPHRMILRSEAEEFAKRAHISYVEVSTKNNENVSTVFEQGITRFFGQTVSKDDSPPYNPSSTTVTAAEFHHYHQKRGFFSLTSINPNATIDEVKASVHKDPNRRSAKILKLLEARNDNLVSLDEFKKLFRVKYDSANFAKQLFQKSRMLKQLDDANMTLQRVYEHALKDVENRTADVLCELIDEKRFSNRPGVKS